MKGHLRSIRSVLLTPLAFSAVLIPALFAGAFGQLREGLGWVWQNPLPQGNPLYSIHFAKDKLTGFAVGSENTILRTRDGGFHWQRQLTTANVTFSGVYVFNERDALVVGSRGTILTTFN